MSAPSAARPCAWAMAAAGSRKRPPSENESGVTFSTPMTNGRPLAKRPRNRPAPGRGGAANHWEDQGLRRFLPIAAAVPRQILKCFLSVGFARSLKASQAAARLRPGTGHGGIFGRSVADQGRSFLALSIQRSTVRFFGNRRTRLRLLASRIRSTRCSDCGT